MEERSHPSSSLLESIQNPETTSPQTTLDHQLRPDLFKALGDPTRLEVLSRLISAPEPLTVSEIADCCGVHLSGVSRHLSMLREAKVVCAEKVGREVRYELDCERLTSALRQLADAIDACRLQCCPPASDCCSGDETP